MGRGGIFCGIFNPTATNYVAIFYNSTMYLKFVNFKMVVLSNNSYEASYKILHMSHMSHFHTSNTLSYETIKSI